MGFVGKQECFISDAGGYRKPVEGMELWDGVGDPGEVEELSFDCILIQFGVQRQTYLPGVKYSSLVSRGQGTECAVWKVMDKSI